MQKECGKSGEFSLISSIERLFEDIVPEGVIGIGDDCAILNQSGDISTVITKDMLLEGIHFTSEMSPWEVGVRSVQVNISDVAAMGATPTALFLGLGLPKDIDKDWCKEFIEGFRSCGVPLLGGDTTSSLSGIVISVTALGTAPTKNLKLRSSAKVGDVVMVTGKLGGSVHSGYKMAVRARCNQGAWLGNQKAVHAMMDLSDGLSGDILHILEKSKVGARIDLEKIPLGRDANIVEALSGGEDYELLFTAERASAQLLQYNYKREFHEELYIVGEITDTMGIRYCEYGYPKELNINGFRHF